MKQDRAISVRRHDILGSDRFCYDSSVPERQKTALIGSCSRGEAAMAVTLFTDRRMLDHRVPARHPERPGAVAGDSSPSRTDRLSGDLPQRAGARGDRR